MANMIKLIMSKTIPQNLQQYFWDIDTQKINVTKNANFIIQRLLDKGDIEAVSWVVNNFSTQSVKKTFVIIRDFSPKIGNFWKLYLKIPKDKILCLQEPYLTMRKSLWPY